MRVLTIVAMQIGSEFNVKDGNFIRYIDSAYMYYSV